MRLPIALVLSLMLAACGQAGDLYLPDHPPRHRNPLAGKPARTGTAPAPAAGASVATPAVAPP